MRAHVARGIGALQALIRVQKEIHVHRMRFGRMPFIHRTQIRVAAHFDLLQLLFLGKNPGQGVAAHHVLVLLGRRASGKSQAHRGLVKHCVRRMNHDRQRARAGQLFYRLRIFRVRVFWFRILQRIGLDRDFDLAAQFHALLLVINQGAD